MLVYTRGSLGELIASAPWSTEVKMNDYIYSYFYSLVKCFCLFTNKLRPTLRPSWSPVQWMSFPRREAYHRRHSGSNINN